MEIKRISDISICPYDQLNLPDRKSTRLNSSHLGSSYAAFCLKKKNREMFSPPPRPPLPRLMVCRHLVCPLHMASPRPPAADISTNRRPATSTQRPPPVQQLHL